MSDGWSVFSLSEQTSRLNVDDQPPAKHSVSNDVDEGQAPRMRQKAPVLDPPDELHLEFINHVFTMGQESFDTKNYVEAEEYFRLALQRYEDLNLPGSALPMDINTLRLKTAICCIAQAHWDDADVILAPMIPGVLDGGPNNQTKENFTAAHLMAQIQLHRGDTKTAEKMIHMAIQGRRKVLGKGDKDYYDSLSILAIICSATGRATEAKVWSSMIPVEFRTNVQSQSTQPAQLASPPRQNPPKPLSRSRVSDATLDKALHLRNKLTKIQSNRPRSSFVGCLPHWASIQNGRSLERGCESELALLRSREIPLGIP